MTGGPDGPAAPRGEEPVLRLRRAGIITKIVVFALVIYAVVTLMNMRVKIEGAVEAAAAMQAEVNTKTATNAALQYQIDNKDDPTVKEKIARDVLGLVAPGEQDFYYNGYAGN